MKKLYFCIFLSVFQISFLFAQVGIKSFSLLNPAVLQYKKAEWNIILTNSFKNPYDQNEVSLDMLLTTPSGKSLILPCYYEATDRSGHLWKARFTPREPGKYRYVFKLSQEGRLAGSSESAVFSVKATTEDGFLQNKDNWTFQFDSGKPFRGIGENIAWESRANDDSKFFKALHENPKYNYEYMLRSLNRHGGNFYRTWICSWNLPLDWKSGFNSNRYTNSTEYYNPGAIKKIDRLMNLSDSLGLYIMLTLGPGAYDVKNGGYATSAADFFINPKAKAHYKNRLRYIIARWGYSTQIAAWELFNEVDNVQFADKNNPINTEFIVKWHDEMSAYIKATDPYRHLVTTSISHRDLEGLNSLTHIDFNQKHIYKNTRSIPETIVKYEQDYQKPYVIGEYGYEWDWSKNFNLFADEMDSDFKRGLWYGLFSPTPILPMSWWWEYFDDRGTDAYLSRIKEISNQMLTAGKGSFRPLQVSVSEPGTEVLGLQCGNKFFVYAFNPASIDRKTTIEFTVDPDLTYQLKRYDCESGRYSEVTNFRLLKNKLQIPGFELAAKSDAVFILSMPGR